MTQFTQNTAMPSSLWQYWRGLSGWNFYFLVKFGLLWRDISTSNRSSICVCRVSADAPSALQPASLAPLDCPADRLCFVLA
ncbi:hypothetical protein ACVXHB_06045 [Escherichia coli]